MGTRLAVTVGDPAGIGPEVVLKALAAAERPQGDFVVYGPARALDDCARRLALRPLAALGVPLVDVGGSDPVPLGRPSAQGGDAAARAVLAAVRDAMAGRLAGHSWPGHTEMLAEAAGAPDVAMMFVGGSLRVALMTIHQPLRSVGDAITPALVRRIVRLVHRELPRFGARGPIGVCGVNPHAGENGLLGGEEGAVVEPAVRALRAEGIDVAGPFPADSLFVRAARGEFAAVIAAYHDQGLVPVKLAAFGHAVNVTIGLPFVRTSVDHGTGFDIVEKGVASETSLIEAMRVGLQLAEKKR